MFLWIHRFRITVDSDDSSASQVSRLSRGPHRASSSPGLQHAFTSVTELKARADH